MHTLTLHKPLFGKQIEIVLDLTDVLWNTEERDHLLDEVYQQALFFQSIFNSFDPTSELSQVNSNRWGILSPELCEVIGKGLERTHKTHWLYDITLGKQILQRKQHLPLTPLQGSYQELVFVWNHLSRSHPDISIDLGSIAKGYIADKIVAELQTRWFSSGLIDARWDIRAFWSYRETLGIQDPRNPEKELAHFTLHNAAVATSWDYLQYDSDFARSHILHQQQTSSITVIAPTLTQADLFATLLFVSAPEEQKKILADHPECIVFAVDTKQQTSTYNDISNLFLP